MGTEAAAEGLHAPAVALLGVLTELAGRYSPERLAVSAGSERVGLAGVMHAPRPESILGGQFWHPKRGILIVRKDPDHRRRIH